MDMNAEQIAEAMTDLVNRPTPDCIAVNGDSYQECHQWKVVAVSTQRVMMFGRVCERCGYANYSEAIIDALPGNAIVVRGRGMTPVGHAMETEEGCDSQYVQVSLSRTETAA